MKALKEWSAAVSVYRDGKPKKLAIMEVDVRSRNALLAHRTVLQGCYSEGYLVRRFITMHQIKEKP